MVSNSNQSVSNHLSLLSLMLIIITDQQKTHPYTAGQRKNHHLYPGRMVSSLGPDFLWISVWRNEMG